MAEEVRAAQGTADQLPQGAAAALNDAMPSELQAPELDPGLAPEGAATEAEAPDLEAAGPADYEPQFSAETEDDDFITGPTTKPEEDVTAGVSAYPNPQRVSPSLLRALPSFVAASGMPGAPAQMRFMAAFLAREANK